MYDEMWEEHTEDLFEEITIERALHPPKCGIDLHLLHHYMESLLRRAERSIFIQKMSNFEENKNGKTIKFRRYPKNPR